MKLDKDDKPQSVLSLFEGKDAISSFTLDGSTKKSGQVTLISGKSDAGYKISLDSKNQHIDITSGKDDNACQILLDSKAGEITAKVNKAHITITKGGKVNIKSEAELNIDAPKVTIKGDVTITGNTEITGKLDVKQ